MMNLLAVLSSKGQPIQIKRWAHHQSNYGSFYQRYLVMSNTTSTQVLQVTPFNLTLWLVTSYKSANNCIISWLQRNTCAHIRHYFTACYVLRQSHLSIEVYLKHALPWRTYQILALRALQLWADNIISCYYFKPQKLLCCWFSLGSYSPTSWMHFPTSP